MIYFVSTHFDIGQIKFKVAEVCKSTKNWLTKCIREAEFHRSWEWL